jgi:cytochrome c2
MKAAFAALFAALVIGLAATVSVRMLGDRETARAAERATGGDAEVGQRKLAQYGCGSCHAIPGVVGARGVVGPSLAGIASRTYLGGTLTNDPGPLIAWIRHPQQVKPGTAMPDSAVSAADGRHMAAYLYTLR